MFDPGQNSDDDLERRAQQRRHEDQEIRSYGERLAGIEVGNQAINEKLAAHLGMLSQINRKFDEFVLKVEFRAHCEWAEKLVATKLDPLYEASLREAGRAEALRAERERDLRSAKAWQWGLATAVASLGVLVMWLHK